MILGLPYKWGNNFYFKLLVYTGNPLGNNIVIYKKGRFSYKAKSNSIYHLVTSFEIVNGKFYKIPCNV